MYYLPIYLSADSYFQQDKTVIRWYKESPGLNLHSAFAMLEHHGCSAGRSEATEWFHHVKMDQSLSGIFWHLTMSRIIKVIPKARVSTICKALKMCWVSLQEIEKLSFKSNENNFLNPSSFKG